MKNIKAPNEHMKDAETLHHKKDIRNLLAVVPVSLDKRAVMVT